MKFTVQHYYCSFAPASRPKNQSSTHIQLQPGACLPQQSLGGTQTVEAPKKIGLVPYSLMSHNPNAATKTKHESDDDDDLGTFFTFDNKDDELPKVSEDEVRALVAKESMRLELRKRQCGESVAHQTSHDLSDQYEQQKHTVDNQNIDAEAMKALMGGNKAKRSRVDDIQIIDLSASEVLPNRDEWLRKTLAGETSYMPTGNIVEKVKTNHLHCNQTDFNRCYFRDHLPCPRESTRFHICQ